MKYPPSELIISIICASLISIIHFFYIQYDKHNLTFVQYAKIYFKIFIINILVMYGILYINKVIFIDKVKLPMFGGFNGVSAPDVLVTPNVTPNLKVPVVDVPVVDVPATLPVDLKVLNNIEISQPPF